MLKSKKGQFLTSWVMIIILIVYCVLANMLIVNYAEQYRKDHTKTEIKTNNSINYNSSSIIDKDVSSIGFFEALFLVSVVEMNFFVTFIFIILPNVLLGVVIYNLIRGNW